MQIIYGLSAQYLSSCRLQALGASRPPPPTPARAGRSCAQAVAARGLWVAEWGSEDRARHQAAFQAKCLSSFSAIHSTFAGGLLCAKLRGLRNWGGKNQFGKIGTGQARPEGRCRRRLLGCPSAFSVPQVSLPTWETHVCGSQIRS